MTEHRADVVERIDTVGSAAAGAAIGSVFSPSVTVVGWIAGGTAGNQTGQRAGHANKMTTLPPMVCYSTVSSCTKI